MLPAVDLLSPLRGRHRWSSSIRPMARRTPPAERSPGEPDPLAEALALEDVIASDPSKVLTAARELLARPRIGPEARSVGLRTLAARAASTGSAGRGRHRGPAGGGDRSTGRARRAGGAGSPHALPRALPCRQSASGAAADRAGGVDGRGAHCPAGVGPARHPARTPGPPGRRAGPLPRRAGRADAATRPPPGPEQPRHRPCLHRQGGRGAGRSRRGDRAGPIRARGHAGGGAASTTRASC